MSVAKTFNEIFYRSDTDVDNAVSRGDFVSAQQLSFSVKELRDPNAVFLILLCGSEPGCRSGCFNGHFTHVFEHYQLFGVENRPPNADFAGFNATSYLEYNGTFRPP